MTLRSLLLASLVALISLPVFAASSLSYDDPGMHFQAPDGWEKIDVSDAGPNQSGDRPVAVYMKDRGRREQRTILITTQEYSGTLDAFERNHETDLRNSSDGTFIDKRTQTTLSNGMPTYFIKASQGSQAGQFVQRYEYIIYDGQRGIVAALIGRAGDFDEKEAKDVLSSLYVVAYPRGRP